MSQILEIKVYDKKGKITKTSMAQVIDLEFGTIRAIMEVLNVESMEDTAQLLKTVYGAWDQVTDVLYQCFPDLSKEDWEHVKVKELMGVIIGILRYSFTEILSLPKN